MASTKFDPDAALVKKPNAADKARAQDHVDRIKAGLVEAPDLLVKFITHDEWRALGYSSLEDCYEKSGLKEAVQKGETSRKVVVDALKKKGFTVRAIAATMEISPATVSRTINDKTGNEARDKRKELGGDDTSGDVTSDVTSVPSDELGKPTTPAKPDEVLKPSATLTPGEVAERSYGRHQALADAYNVLTDAEKSAFMSTVCLPGGTVSVKRRVDQLKYDLLTAREEARQIQERANHDKRPDDDADYDEMGDMLTRD